jgi:hypothetical protein
VESKHNIFGVEEVKPTPSSEPQEIESDSPDDDYDEDKQF